MSNEQDQWLKVASMLRCKMKLLAEEIDFGNVPYDQMKGFINSFWEAMDFEIDAMCFDVAVEKGQKSFD